MGDGERHREVCEPPRQELFDDPNPSARRVGRPIVRGFATDKPRAD